MKLQLIQGDLGELNLGLSKSDESELTENVQVVFHLAESAKFSDGLRLAVDANASGTLRMIQLAQKMRNLQSFLHLSSVFIQCNQAQTSEAYCSTHYNPMEVIQTTKELEDAVSLKLYEENL